MTSFGILLKQYLLWAAVIVVILTGDYLEGHLKFNESEELHLQIKAYLDNQVDVAQLLEEKEMKEFLEAKNEELEEELGKERELMSEFEVGGNLWRKVHLLQTSLENQAF